MHRPIGIYKYNDQQISTMSASDAGGLQLIKDDVSKYVKLNVGGCLFQTTIGTLTKYDTMLRGMFSGDVPVQTDSDGNLTTGRNPIRTTNNLQHKSRTTYPVFQFKRPSDLFYKFI